MVTMVLKRGLGLLVVLLVLAACSSTTDTMSSDESVEQQMNENIQQVLQTNDEFDKFQEILRGDLSDYTVTEAKPLTQELLTVEYLNGTMNDPQAYVPHLARQPLSDTTYLLTLTAPTSTDIIYALVDVESQESYLTIVQHNVAYRSALQVG
jgi:hypothetical protein